VAKILCLCKESSWEHEAMRLAFGAVDFCEPVRGHNGRKRAYWWSQFLGGLEPERIVAKRQTSDLDRFAGWLRRCAAPKLEAMGRLTGRTKGEVLELLASDVVADADDMNDPVVRQFASEFPGAGIVENRVK
jgi:hypothetical protein